MKLGAMSKKAGIEVIKWAGSRYRSEAATQRPWISRAVQQ